MNSKLTLNYGVRIEHEDGLREIENRQTVGFDQSATNPIDALVNKTGTHPAGRTIRGGLLFAGVDGAPEEQGDPPALKVAPRVGVAYAANAATVLRGGYGVFYAPWQCNATNHGQVGFRVERRSVSRPPRATRPSRRWTIRFLADCSSRSAARWASSPAWAAPSASSIRTRVRPSSISARSTCSASSAARWPSPSATRERPDAISASREPITSVSTSTKSIRNLRGRCSGAGRRVERRSAAAIRAQSVLRDCPGRRAGDARTVPLGQLLRPFPEFGDVTMFERTDGGKRQYHAVTLELEKRVCSRSWWGGRYSYTWSRLEDNQFGEDSAYQTRTATPQNVYDLEAEHSQQLRLATSHHPGADHPLSRTVAACALARLVGQRDRRARERLATQRRDERGRL